MKMPLLRCAAALTVWTALLWAQSEDARMHAVTAVRHWSSGDVTRVAVEVSGEFTYRTDTLHNPDRVYFDIPNSHPRLGQHLFWVESLDDARVKRLRVAETTRGVTRVVLDLAGPFSVSTSQLSNPERLMIEVRGGPVTADSKTPASPASEPAATAAPLPDPPRTGPLPPARSAVKSVPVVNDLAAEEMGTAEPSKSQLAPEKTPDKTPEKAPEKTDDPPIQRPEREAAKPAPPARGPIATAATLEPAGPSGPSPVDTPRAARRTAGGDSSLVRELGLKISRVVIDPGHGGHDHGTEGAHGLEEKELVLDVAKRVGKLIEEKMGAEVVYTRSDDTFVGLEHRTALANEKKADLFLSIHANSSPATKIAGVETYYLNFPDSKDAVDVAARENAAAQESISELHDLIQKITLHDKAEESREFAGRVQSALYAFSLRNFPASHNRGVKKAPFVVLIGAQMPSILAEIGFLSNLREEALLKRPDYRQRLAEALYQGVRRYADSLSHFQVAQQAQSQP